MSRVLELACAQMGIILTILRRDTWKRLSSSATICVAILYFAGWQWAVLTAATVLLNDLMFYFLYRKSTDPHARINRVRTIAAIIGVSASMLVYTLPGIVLMAQPIQAAQILGLFWNCAALVYILAIFSMTVVLGWSTIAVHTLGLAAGIAVMHRGPVAPVTNTDLAVLAFFTGLWLWNTYEFMNAAANNRRAFGEARWQAEERADQLDFLVHHDHLTGLLNRRAFEEVLSDVLLALEAHEDVAVALFDLDGFKPVNDTYGHAAGDAVLIAVAERMTKSTALQFPARLGGDEFVALVPNVSPADLPFLLDGVSDALAAPIPFEGNILTIGTSVGFAVALPGSTVAELVGHADTRMYKQKSRRKSDRRKDSDRRSTG